MNVADYLQATGMNLHQLAGQAGISYTTLHPHVRHGKQLSVETAKKLQEWSERQPAAAEGNVMSAADILDLTASGAA